VSAVRARPARPRRRPPARESDAERTTIAANLQITCARWLVIWSPWRRTYTGFACFTQEPTIVDEAKVDAFLARVGQVETAYRRQSINHT
jgi:hypothetical protein